MSELLDKLLSESALAYTDATSLHGRIYDRIERVSGKLAAAAGTDGEINDDVYDHALRTLTAKFYKQLGASESLKREETYELDKVIKFIKAPLRGFTVLVVNGEYSDWEISWYKPKAAEVFRNWSTFKDDQLKAMVPPLTPSPRRNTLS